MDNSNISWSNSEGRRGVHTLTGSQSSVNSVSISVSNIVMDPPPATEYSTDEGEFEEQDTAAVCTTGQALDTITVPVEVRNTAKRHMSGRKISKVTQGYNLNYFTLWWHRMGVESRKEEKELKRKEGSQEGRQEEEVFHQDGLDQEGSIQSQDYLGRYL